MARAKALREFESPRFRFDMNITLIGMPGSGKSYIGKKLALRLGFRLIELDQIMEDSYKKPLQGILDEMGDTAFLAQQSQDAINETTGCTNTVISPGGSIIYGEDAMRHLQQISTIVYLKTSLNVIEQRITALPRGIVGLRAKTFSAIYAERTVLYTQWADIVIDADRDSLEILNDIQSQIVSPAT